MTPGKEEVILHKPQWKLRFIRKWQQFTLAKQHIINLPKFRSLNQHSQARRVGGSLLTELILTTK